MTKQELVSQLENAKNNYILGLSAISLFSDKRSQIILNESSANFGQYSIQFKQVSVLLQNINDREIAVKEFLTSQIRALIKESFEIIKSFCTDSGQSTIFKSKDWYQFARMIRNCLSHNFKFIFNNYDKSLLPVSWKQRVIRESMDTNNFSLDFFGYVETWELFNEFQTFVNNDLN